MGTQKTFYVIVSLKYEINRKKDDIRNTNKRTRGGDGRNSITFPP